MTQAFFTCSELALLVLHMESLLLLGPWRGDRALQRGMIHKHTGLKNTAFDLS